MSPYLCRYLCLEGEGTKRHNAEVCEPKQKKHYPPHSFPKSRGIVGKTHGKSMAISQKNTCVGIYVATWASFAVTVCAARDTCPMPSGKILIVACVKE